MIVIKVDIDLILLIITFIMIGISLVYIFFDVHYIIKMILTSWWSRFFQSKIKINAICSIYGICGMSDMDLNLQQMNSGRYVKELDFAKLQFCERTGLNEAISLANGTLSQSTTFITYKMPISLFTPYRITTKLLFWEETEIYFQHEFITLLDDILCADVISKQKVTGINVHHLICKLLDKSIDEKPKKPLELDHFCQCFDITNRKNEL